MMSCIRLGTIMTMAGGSVVLMPAMVCLVVEYLAEVRNDT